MKKQRNRPNQKTRKKTAKPAQQDIPTNRRALLRNGAIGLVALGAGGFFAVSQVTASLAEQDMSKVGQGTPAIVQIHDPNCASCQQLQREARAALDGFEDADLVYLVANLASDDGAAFANKHGATRVTLLLFDGAGQLQSRMQGVRNRDELATAFKALMDQDT